MSLPQSTYMYVLGNSGRIGWQWASYFRQVHAHELGVYPKVQGLSREPVHDDRILSHELHRPTICMARFFVIFVYAQRREFPLQTFFIVTYTKKLMVCSKT